MTNTDLILTMVSAFLGALLSLLASLVIENLRKPKLSFQIEDPPFDAKYPRHPAKSARFLRVFLLNKPIHLFTRNSALQCHGYVQFHHYEDGAPLFDKPMPLRWSGAGDPFSPHIAPDGRVVQMLDPVKYQASFWRNCHPSVPEMVDIAARFDNDKECYGWTTGNYLCQWRNPDWKIPKGRYLVVITVETAGEKVKEVCQLENSVGKKGFRLLNATPMDRKKLRSWQ